MKHVKRTTAEKKKEAARPRNHPRMKSEKIEIKRPVPDQDQAAVPDNRMINPNKPWKTIEEVEIASLHYTDWFNNTRLYEENGDIPPVELEQAYYRQHRHSA